MGIVLGSVLQQGALGRRFDDVIRAKPMWLSPVRRAQFLAFYDFLDDLGMNLKPAREMGMATIKVIDPDSALAELEMILGFALR